MSNEEKLVDEEIKIRALFINESYSSYSKVTSYLEAKDVEITMASNIQEIILKLTQNKNFDIVYLSLGAPISKITMIPPLLENAFGLKTITYLSSDDRQQISRLRQVKSAYQISSLVSGANLYRAMQSVLSDEEDTEESAEESGRSTNKLKKKKENIRVRGNKDSFKDKVILQRTKRAEKMKNNTAAKDVKSQLLNLEKEDSVGKKNTTTLAKNKNLKEVQKKTTEENQIEQILPGPREERILEEAKENQVNQSVIDQLIGLNAATQAAAKKPLNKSRELDLKKTKIEKKNDKNNIKGIQNKIGKKLRKLSAKDSERLKKLEDIKNAKTSSMAHGCFIVYQTGDVYRLTLLSSEKPFQKEILEKEELFSKLLFGSDQYKLVCTIPYSDISREEIEKISKRQETKELTYGKEPYSISLLKDPVKIPDVERINQAIACVDFEFIQANEKMNFDLYIYLEKNQKYYHYIKKGCVLTAEKKQKFLARKDKAYFSIEDIPGFYSAYYRALYMSISESKKAA